MSIIERWKSNTSAFGLMDKELQEVALKIGKQAFILYREKDIWEKTDDGDFLEDCVYRIHQNWQCPHLETKKGFADHEFCGHEAIVCSWCGAEMPPEKKAGWVEYPLIHCDDGIYTRYQARIGTSDIDLTFCIDMVGFGGIKYGAPDGAGETRDFLMVPPNADRELGPWKPVMIRFWKEEKS